MIILGWEKLYGTMLVFENVRLVHGSNVDNGG
jgi:hypothetical protein